MSELEKKKKQRQSLPTAISATTEQQFNVLVTTKYAADKEKLRHHALRSLTKNIYYHYQYCCNVNSDFGQFPTYALIKSESVGNFCSLLKKVIREETHNKNCFRPILVVLQ